MNEDSAVSVRGISMTQNTNSFSKLSADISLKDTACLYFAGEQPSMCTLS